jgi:glycosyl hydrolase family 26
VGTESDLTLARGRFLLLSWAAADTRRIAAGEEDAVIRQRAREVRALPTKVFLRWRWEMDRPNLAGVVHSAEDYVRAWRHIRAVFAAERVRNAGWVWCPTAAGFSTGRAQAYYPGDGQVDWVCADVYPEKPWVKGSYEPFGVLAQPFVRWAADRPKPAMIGEYGVPREYAARRARWLTAAAAFARDTPQLKAMVYFAADPPDRPVEDHVDVRGDPAATAALAGTASDPWFNPRR